MNMISKGFRAIWYCFETVVAKLRWGNALHVEGLFRKEFDTRIKISNNGKITLKKHVRFCKNVYLASVEGNLNIGQNVFFNHNCLLVCRKKITIEDHVLFGPGVTIYDHDHIFSYQGILPGYKLGEIVIEKGCWIGANVTILRDTHIGTGSVIGAGAIVKGNIPPHSLVTSDRDLRIVPIEKRD